jgi:hypothetical protein
VVSASKQLGGGGGRRVPTTVTGLTLAFTDDVNGAMPSGMTRKWELANSPWAVAAVAEATDGKALRYTGSIGNTNPSALRGVAIDSAGDSAGDATVTVKFKSSVVNQVLFPIILRGGGTAAAITGYALRRNTTGVWNVMRLSGTATTPTQTVVGANMTSAPTVVAEAWVWAKMQVIGTALKAKAWLDSGSEPASWQIETTDANHGSGWMGICSPSAYQPVQDFDQVTIA